MSQEEQTQEEVAQFESLSERSSESPSSQDLNRVLHIPVTLSVEIGRTQMQVGDLLKVKQGSVITLDQKVGSAFYIRANGTLIAHGEIVVMGENFGVRFTEIISPEERKEKLM